MSRAAGPPGWSKSAIAPAQPAPAAVAALAIKIAKNDYPGYTAIVRYPPTPLMIETGLWLELEAVVAFTVGLGLASLMGQRTVPVILLIVFQIIFTPILSAVVIPHLQDLQRSVVGLAVAHLEPSGLPMGFGVPGWPEASRARAPRSHCCPSRPPRPPASSSPGWRAGRSSVPGE